MSIGFVPPQRKMATLNADCERIRALRTQRAWSQEQLADIAGVSYRTIQRIEGGGRSSFESLRAIAAAFDVDVNEMIRKAETPADSGPKPQASPRFLTRITTGRALFNVIGGAHAGEFDHDELQSQEEADLIGSFLQDMRDYLDIWDEIEPGNRVQATFDYTERIEELERAGFWVFVGRFRGCVRSGPDLSDDWQIATILISRSDNPEIIRFPPNQESVTTKRTADTN